LDVVEALLYLKHNMSELGRRCGAKETDLLFLNQLLENPSLFSLVKVCPHLFLEPILGKTKIHNGPNVN
jgi:hypothetical protein